MTQEVNVTLSRAKYKRLPDLYVTGREVVLRDGSVLWMQALNPLEKDEAQHDAHVARSRLVMALKSDAGSDERTKLQASFLDDGHDVAVERIVASKTSDQLWKTVEAVHNDPEWTERLEIMSRSSDILSRPLEDAERQLLDQINMDYLTEIGKRQDDEAAFLRRSYAEMSDELLVEEYVDLYMERRGNELAAAEFALTEIWFAARCCEGTRGDDGVWDHSGCEQHDLRVYETKAETRSLPEELQQQLMAVMAEVNMQVREAKNSARQGSSSDSSPLPSRVAESTASIPIVTLDEPLGTSSSLSDTPLAS